MDAKQKRNLLIGISATAILGTAGYLIWSMSKPKKPKGSGETDSGKTPPIIDNSNTTTTTTTSTGGSRPDDVLHFQKWVIYGKKDTSILGGGGQSGMGDDGTFGTKTANAWSKYGAEYKKSGLNFTPPTTTVQTGTTTTTSTVPQSRSELATNYRAWANSTDALSKKYGKQSQYDLDATGSANAFFDRSYAAGKTEYEAYLLSLAAITEDSLPNILKGVNLNIPDSWHQARMFGKNAAGNFYIRLNTSGGKYLYWFDSGNWKVWDTKTSKKLSNGTYSNGGRTATGVDGIQKGKTFTMANAPSTLLLFVSDPNQQTSWTDKSYTDAVVKMYDAMKGPGTFVNQFNSWFKLMTKTAADYSKFYDRFGKRDGYTFYQWVKGESDLMTAAQKKFRNDRLQAINPGFSQW